MSWKIEWWGEKTANFFAVTEEGRDIWDGSQLCRSMIWVIGEKANVFRICINLP
jgi:hypothetical protein